MGMDYIETSAYTNQNVANAVVFTLRKIMELTKKGYVLEKKTNVINTSLKKQKKNRRDHDCPC